MAKIQGVKGTRDFYPQQMAVHNYLLDGWRAASRRNGFEEYEGPIFEYLKMYQVKSGDEIVEQLFHFQDRGGRQLAIRPEITPTLARMVNQQINALAKPIKWFSLPRMCRAERPQKGRLREFWQWNIDIIGQEGVLADAEVIFTTLDYLQDVGLGPEDIVAKISSRRLLAAFLKSIGVEESSLESLYALLDKKAKLPGEIFHEKLTEQLGDSQKEQRVNEFMNAAGPFDRMAQKLFSDSDGELRQASDELLELFSTLDAMGVARFCEFDPSIVRGLAYYTGMVFEVHDRSGELRAICGGGRYDNLLKDFGGPPTGATGMGMGDCVLEILLQEKGLLGDRVPPSRQIEYFIAYADAQFQNKALAVLAGLRRTGKSAEISYKTTSLGKQLKQASALGSEKAIIIGEESLSGKAGLKDLRTGEQVEVELSTLIPSV